MTAKQVLISGGILGALSVAIGAFSAHGLKEALIQNGRLETFDTAVKYQFFHTLALISAGILMLKYKSKFYTYTAYCLLGGIIIFSGSLYILSITNITIFGAITPIGGILFIVGWLLFTVAVSKSINT